MLYDHDVPLLPAFILAISIGLPIYFFASLHRSETDEQENRSKKMMSALANEFKRNANFPKDSAKIVVITCEDGRIMILNEEDGTLQVLKR